LLGSASAAQADSNASDAEGQESAYMYKWPWMDRHPYNMSAAGVEGD